MRFARDDFGLKAEPPLRESSALQKKSSAPICRDVQRVFSKMAIHGILKNGI